MNLKPLPSARSILGAFVIPLLAILGAGAANGQDPLTWAPPELEEPIVLNLNNSWRSTTLEPGKDYIINLTEKIDQSYGIRIYGNGARHIVMIGGEIDIPNAGDYENVEDFAHKRRGLYIKDWTGICHIEGVWIHGEDLNEGINIDSRSPGCVLQLQNVRVDNVHSRPEELGDWQGRAHPDILQFWGGPNFLRIDRFTGYSDYQGFMMQPLQFGKTPLEIADWRDVDLHHLNPDVGGSYMLFWAKGSAPYSIRNWNLENVWVNPRHGNGVYPHNDPAFEAVNVGVPPGGNFVPEGVAGMDYESPGYANEYVEAHGLHVVETADGEYIYPPKLGRLYASILPWAWSYTTENWLYIDEGTSFTADEGAWIYMSR